MPLEEGKVGLYVCGITVYDLSHMGHARTYLSFDVLVRYLRHLGYGVKYVRNITDIDDKIINRANENNESFEVLTKRTIGMMHEDFAAINLLEPDVEPTVSGHMPEIIDIIERLVEKGYAYQAQSGDVLFDVSKYEDYGKLSKQDLKPEIMDVTPEEVVKTMEKWGVQRMIHGHTHRPNIHSLTANKRMAK